MIISPFLRLIKSLRKDITILFLICLITILCIDFWLINIPELFSGGAKMGDIIFKLCLSYISAFIFYFLVVHIKAQKDKANLNSYITKKIEIVIRSYTDLITELSKAANLSLEGKYPTEIELQTICERINPNSSAPLYWGIKSKQLANWIQYFEFQRGHSAIAIEKIFLKMPFLDSKLVNILAYIDDSSYFWITKFMVSAMPISNSDLKAYKNPLFDYISLIKQLEEYADKNLKEFQTTK